MTILVKIGEYEKEIADIRPDWITDEINRRRKLGEPVCVQVKIVQGQVNLMLSTTDCARRGGGSRHPNSEEQHILDLWEQLHLDESQFSAGNLISFLQRITR